jgi:hypothetical protein
VKRRWSTAGLKPAPECRLHVHLPSNRFVLVSLLTLARDESNRGAALAVEYSEMKHFAPPTPLVLHSDLSPDECERCLE